MKRLHTGMIVLDTIEILCISFSAGSAYLIKKYRKYKGRGSEDRIVTELKEKSPVIMFSEDRKPLKLPSVRGRDELTEVSLSIKKKKLPI